MWYVFMYLYCSIFYVCSMFIDMYVFIVYVCAWCGMYVCVCGRFFCCLFNPLCFLISSFQDLVIYENEKDLAQQFFFPKMPVKLLRVLPTS